MLELNINPRSPAAISGAIKKIKEMTSSGAVSKTSTIRLVLEPGSYREVVHYNLSNPLVMESVPGTKAENCVIQADNCESYNQGLQNRGIFVIGPNATSVTLKNFSIINSHNKSSEEGINLQDSAEALVWNNTNGFLSCEGLRIEGRQNTLALKGCSWFLDSFISGDTNFIYGDVKTAYFEDCHIYVREDDRGDFPAFVVNSQSYANCSGFVFSGCTFTGEKRRKNSIFLVRTDGRGKADSEKNWDNVALVNCTMSDVYDEGLLFDDDMSLEVYPRGNARCGIREYKTMISDKNGNTTEADTTLRSNMIYTLTETDYFNGYSSRFMILHETPFARKQ